MSANLTINNGQAEMFSGNNIIPWHKQGTVVEGLLTAAEAIEAAHLDWEVEKVPLYYGESKAEYPKMVCIRRTDNNVPLSITNNTYTLIQNKEAFGFFDEIIGSGQAVYDTAGSLKNGAVVWLQASVPGNLFVKSRPDDTVEKRILFITSHNREFALTAMITPHRCVCSNTLNAAIGNHTNKFKAYHRTNYKTKISEAKRVLNLTNAYYEELQTLINKLDTISLRQEDAVEFLVDLFDKDTEDLNTKQVTINHLFHSGKGNRGKTAWDMFNGVTEYLDHYTQYKRTKSRVDSTKVSNDHFTNILFGSAANLKQKALNLLLN